jgi:Flp pilus assembly protein TadB
MDTTIFTNILFIAISVFLIFITVGFVILMVYVVLVLKSINKLFNHIRKESEKFAQDIGNVRGKIKSGEAMLVALIVGLVSFFKNHRKKSKK